MDDVLDLERRVEALTTERDALAAEVRRLRAIERAAWAVRDSQPASGVRHQIALIILGEA